MNFQRTRVHFGCLRLACFLWLLGGAHAFAQPDATPVTNGSTREVAAVTQLLSRLDAGVSTRDAGTLRFFGVDGNAATPLPILSAQTRVSHIAFSPTGALVRQAY